MMIAIAVVAILGGCAVIAFSITMLFRNRTGYMTDYGRELLPCNRCTAGTQWYDQRTGWGPIPMSVRIFKYDAAAEVYGPPSGNVRTCNCCHGMNGHYVDGKESRLGSN